MAITLFDPHSLKPNAAWKLHGSGCCRSKLYIAGIEIFDLFGSCDLDFDLMTFIYELDLYSLKIYWLCESELPTSTLSKVLYVYFVTRGHFRSRDKDDGHAIRSAVVENPMLWANFMALCFMEPELLAIEVLHCENGNFQPFRLM